MEGAKILCVDDDKGILRALASVLKEHGYEAVTAESGYEALRLFGKHHNSLVGILMDLRMPVKDGLETARSIRNIGGQNQGLAEHGLKIPIVALSAYLIADERQDKPGGITIEECKNAGMQGYIIKPFKIGELLDSVHFFFDEYARKTLGAGLGN